MEIEYLLREGEREAHLVYSHNSRTRALVSLGGFLRGDIEAHESSDISERSYKRPQDLVYRTKIKVHTRFINNYWEAVREAENVASSEDASGFFADEALRMKEAAIKRFGPDLRRCLEAQNVKMIPAEQRPSSQHF